jgi:protein involved in polysaccharide export with SLBB domain
MTPRMTRRQIPFFLAAAVALVHVTLIVRAGLRHTGGTFTYPIDDAFIHLAIAKHLVFDGVYGITRYAFTAASSSIVWPFLLAGVMKVVGDQVTIPLFLNVAAGVALVWVLHRALEREAPAFGPALRTLVLVGIVFLIPLAALMAIGMEHVLHMALTVAFVVEGSLVVAGEKEPGWALAFLGAALTATRYEGFFPVGLVAGLLLLRRRFVGAVRLAALAAAPAVVFGLWSKAHGYLFFPNSIALKRQHFTLGSVGDVLEFAGGKALDRVSTESYLLPLAGALAVLLAIELRRAGPWSKNAVRLLVAFVTTVAHLQLASLGWFYRYEAYLICLDLAVIALALGAAPARVSLRETLRRFPLVVAAVVVAVIVVAAPLSQRAIKAQGATPLAYRNIYEQQVQVARFFRQYFPNEAVAINDVGAVSYFGDAPVVDLVGLANMPVALAKSLDINTDLTPAQLAELAKPAPIVVVYDNWFPHPPASWVQVGRWRIDVNRVCAGEAVSFYATSGETVPRVLQALRAFSATELPATVRREGRFVESPPSDPWHGDTGDLLYVDVDGAPELSGMAPVLPDGTFLVKKIGAVKARGLDLPAIQAGLRAKAQAPALPIPAGVDPRVRLVEARWCHVYVSGRVLSAIETWVPCGAELGQALAPAGLLEPDAPVDVYAWREEGGELRKIEVDRFHERVKGGDVIIVGERSARASTR